MTKLCAGDWVEVRSKEEILRTSCTEQDVLAATRVHGQSDSKSTRYSCQATELPRFTTPFPWWDLSQYLLLDEFPRGAFWPFAMRRYDIIHTHWHDFYLGPQRGKLFLLVVLSNALFFAQQKLRGAGVVWTVHDAHSLQDTHPMVAATYRRFLRAKVDAWIALIERSVKEAVDLRPWLARLPHESIPHGHYRDVYPARFARGS